MNTSTPRLFIAATHQNAGKTTTALGLYSILHAKLGRIGFIKPVGQRFAQVNGRQIDEDSVLIHATYDTQTPIEDMSPIAVEPNFTRNYIDGSNQEILQRRIQDSFDRAAWEKDFVLIEGSGHAGVGSVFDLSNARVAKLVESKAIIVTQGGIGRPIDEVALNRALFEREGVEVLGVVMNKVIPSKLEMARDFAQRGLRRLGLELLGVIPNETLLSDPTFQQICEHIGGELISENIYTRWKIRHILIGAMSPGNLFARLSPGTLLIVPGDREDIISAAISVAQQGSAFIRGLVLSDNFMPDERILGLLKNAGFPVMASAHDSYRIASAIDSMTIKTLPGDTERIERIQQLFEECLDIDGILKKVMPS